MATLIIRNLPVRVMRDLEALAKRRGISINQLARTLLQNHVTERTAVLEEIEASWKKQTRRPTGLEIDSWINAGRD